MPGVGGPQDIQTYQGAISKGALNIRISMMIDGTFLLSQSGGFLTGFGNERLKIGLAKLVGDGSIQGYTGWLCEPYFTPFQVDGGYRGYPVTAP